jgi:exopolyphosphatase/guanosine-5'-triphosphate,3'-diphosphate pyrophosphatase
MRIAIIDMGTNTFHLMVATIENGAYEILLRDYEAVKIGKAGINQGMINPEAGERALAAMKRFRAIIDKNHVTTVYAYATSAFRNAKNGRDLAREIEIKTGIAIQIISGDEEAELIFAGISEAVNLENECSLTMDIGAGSVEFIIGNHRQILWKQSFEIGGQRLVEKFQKHDPILPEEISELDRYFEENLQTLFISLERYQPTTLVGSSGSFDTLSSIFCRRHNIPVKEDDPETPLTHEGFYEIYHDFIRKNREERMRMNGMIELRVDMIVVASCLIRFVLEHHDFKQIRVSGYSLKEGVLALIARQSLPTKAHGRPAH